MTSLVQLPVLAAEAEDETSETIFMRLPEYRDYFLVKTVAERRVSDSWSVAESQSYQPLRPVFLHRESHTCQCQSHEHLAVGCIVYSAHNAHVRHHLAQSG